MTRRAAAIKCHPRAGPLPYPWLRITHTEEDRMKPRRWTLASAMAATLVVVFASTGLEARQHARHSSRHGQHSHRKHPSPPPPTTLRVATPFATGHILADTALEFERRIEASSRGRIQVE